MRTYLQTIQFLQKFFLGLSILIMLILPGIIVFLPDGLSGNTVMNLYDISHITVLFVMIIRPLADIFTKTNLIRPLVILRKGVGVLSASIILAFIFSKIIIDPSGYFLSFATLKYWSLDNFILLAHLADISAIILIITSNNLSKRIMGTWWKKVQKLSYIYFYSSSLYVFLVFKDNWILVSLLLVTILTMMAYVINLRRKNIIQSQNI
jgi:DMSO/TMAO reductase YedYZ heme-binding membrane subunit